MFYCRTCNIITYDCNKQEHEKCTYIKDLPYTGGKDTVIKRQIRLKKFMIEDTVYLNDKTPSELIEINEALKYDIMYNM